MLDSAMALGRIALGTRLGASADSAGPLNARTIPSTIATPNNTVTVSVSFQVNQARVPAQPSWASTVRRAMLRRSKWSAAQPEKGVSRNSGMNCSRPISASWPDAAPTPIPPSRARL